MPRKTPTVLLAALAALAGAPSAGRAQAWSVGRPDPQPEFSPSSGPAYPSRPAQAAKAPQQVVLPSAGSPAQASVELHPASGQAEGDSVLVDELEVIVRAPGPAVYTVTRGDAQVAVFASYSPLPHMLQWDQRRLAASLDGARALLMPPEPRIGVFEGAGLMLKAGVLRPPGFTPLEDRLPPDLKAKYLRAAKLAGQDPRKYGKWRPAAAGFWLLGDFRRAAGLSDLKPGTTIARLAKAKGVRIERAGRLAVGGALGSLISMPEPQQLACLDAAADQVIYEAAHARAAADAWAQGRLREVKAQTSDAVLDRCLLPQAGVRAALDRSAADAAKAISEALSKPGRTVAVVDVRLLDRPDGVLDRLKAQGAQVTVPGL